MFGHTYFGAAYFGPRYFGPSAGPPVVIVEAIPEFTLANRVFRQAALTQANENGRELQLSNRIFRRLERP